MTGSAAKVVRFAAVGDLLLAPHPNAGCYRRDAGLVSPAVGALLAQHDVVFGNLECALAGDGRCVPTEPRVLATPNLVRAVKRAGFGVVALANNHVFDCLDQGFCNLRSLLDQIGLRYFGAGMNLAEAATPLILEVNGLRLAFLGAVDQRSGPSHIAGATQSGVAPLDMDRLAEQVRALRSRVDHVLVSLHWGEERFRVPAPSQIEQAHALVDAGASLVLGHHPHVLQGMEMRRGAVIVYSLGNFVADEVYFSDGDAVRWSRSGRTGCILQATLTGHGVGDVCQRPTYDPGDVVDLDDTAAGRRRAEQAQRAIARGVTPARYRRERWWIQTIKPMLGRLRWSSLGKLRLRRRQR